MKKRKRRNPPNDNVYAYWVNFNFDEVIQPDEYWLQFPLSSVVGKECKKVIDAAVEIIMQSQKAYGPKSRETRQTARHLLQDVASIMNTFMYG